MRPVLRDDIPVVWRDPATLEVGDPPRSQQVADCRPEVAEWILALDGSSTCREVLAVAVNRGIPAQLARDILAGLDRVGALDDLAVPPPLHDAPTEHRLALLGQAAAAGHAYGGTRLVSEVMSARLRARVEISGSGPGALSHLVEPLAALLTASGIGCVTIAPRAVSTDADLHILARVGHPEIPDDAGALPLRRSHLPVTTLGARARIGPVVEPGRTPCLRCLSLDRGDIDPRSSQPWPQRAAQIATGRGRRGLAVALDSALAAAATAQTALLAVAWIDSGIVGDAARTPGRLVDLRLPGAIPVTRTVAFHPDCACRSDSCRVPESA